MSDLRRLGVFGGTFDPVHNAHLAIARAALEQARLDEVLFVVAARPPHKSERAMCASADQRLAMVAAALANEPRMEASRIEIDRDGPSYTADTLEALAALHPDASLFLLIGHDSMQDLPRWRRPERILELARLLVVPRPGESSAVPDVLRGRYALLAFPETPTSSTEIRERFLRGLPVSGMLPPPVEALIRREGIYPCT